jgi:hypothetical protein
MYLWVLLRKIQANDQSAVHAPNPQAAWSIAADRTTSNPSTHPNATLRNPTHQVSTYSTVQVAATNQSGGGDIIPRSYYNQIEPVRLGEREIEEDEESWRKEEDSEDEDLEMPRQGSVSKADETIILLRDQDPPSTSNWPLQVSPGRFVMITDNDRTLYHRAMIVMAKSADSTLQCVSLCHHPGLVPKDLRKFRKTHMAVSAQQGSNQPATSSTDTVVVTFQDDVLDTCRLRENCWINCQHVWTIRSDVLLSLLGHVDDFTPLLTKFCEIQESLYKDVRKELKEE